MVERCNKYIHNLPPLQAGDTVAIQSPLNHWCNTPGKIITVPPDCQYRIRVDGLGRIILRNHRFLRKCKIKIVLTPIPSATPVPITSTSTLIPQHLLVMTHVQQLNPPNKPHIHHHTFSHRDFLKLCTGYYHITGQVSKKDTALIPPSQLVELGGEAEIEKSQL